MLLCYTKDLMLTGSGEQHSEFACQRVGDKAFKKVHGLLTPLKFPGALLEHMITFLLK